MTLSCPNSSYKYSVFRHVVKKKVALFLGNESRVVRVADSLIGKILEKKNPHPFKQKETGNFLGKFLRRIF